MAEYRFYCLRADGRIAYGTHVDALDLEAAIKMAHDVCGSHPAGPFYRIEIWHKGAIVHPKPQAP
jgi:hypothetical protein